MEKGKNTGKRIRRIFSTVLFLVLFLCLFFFLSEILELKNGDENQSVSIKGFYTQDENSIDVLCFGSSHAFTSFLPNVFWEDYGVTSYVIGGSSQTVACSYYLLLEALKYQNPKVVLIEGYNLRSDEFFSSEERFHRNIDGMRLGKEKAELINAALYNYNLKDRMPFYFPFLLYHSRWDDLESRDFSQKYWSKGSCTSAICVPADVPDLGKISEVEIPAGAIEYFERIRELCRSRNIALAVFITPMHEGDTEDDREWYMERQGKMLSVEKYLSQTDVPVYFCQMDGEIDIDYASDFEDQEHPNVFLAEKITRNIGGHLVEDFGLENHFQEPAYESWNRDSETYHAHVDKIVKVEEGGK